MRNLSDYKSEYDGLEKKKNLKGEEALKTVREDGYALQYVKEQTKEICLEAVREDGYALQFVHSQTEEICLAAVRKDGCALQFVKEQTKEICLEAVRECGLALEYVHEQTEEICLEAVRENEDALMYVDEDMFIKDKENISTELDDFRIAHSIEPIKIYINNISQILNYLLDYSHDPKICTLKDKNEEMRNIVEGIENENNY